jgi:hypothetical protein
MIAIAAACAIGTARVAMSQNPAQNNPYPMNDLPVTLSSGTVVHVRNMVAFQNQNQTVLSLFIQTPTPPSQRDSVFQEAKELTKIQVSSPFAQNPSSVRVGVCRTQACLEMRETPTEMFLFVRQTDGSWQPDKLPSSQ